MTNLANDVYLTTKEAAAYLRLSVSTLQKIRVTGEGPSFCKLGSRVVYRKSNLDDWATRCARRSTSDNPMAA